MEKLSKPLDIYVKRKRGLTAFAAVMWIAAAAAFCVVYFVCIMPQEFDDSALIIELGIGMNAWAAIMIVIGALCVRNMFYEFVFTADRDGVNDYSGFIHGGHIEWSEIKSVTYGNNNKALDTLDMLNGNAPCVTLDLVTAERTENKRKRRFGAVKIKTLCAPIKNKELYLLLSGMHEYYASDAASGE